MEFGGLPPLCYASGLPGHGACGVQTGRDQASPYESESKLSHSKFPFGPFRLCGNGTGSTDNINSNFRCVLPCQSI
jgi:hypothetical protein